MLEGDLFDVFPIDRWNTGIYIVDIAGHGIMSSMMTMFIRQTLRAIDRKVLSPSRVLRDLLHKFNELGLDDSSFFTIFFGIYDCRNREFVYSNGGHNSPILYRFGQIRPLEDSGLPICNLADGYEYTEKTVELDRGNVLYLYTDGITEARNPLGKFFEEAGLFPAVQEGNSVDRVMAQLEKFCFGNFKDDIALLRLEIL